eukprot:1138221-Pelagomonas_calceolata.AAC.2
MFSEGGVPSQSGAFSEKEEVLVSGLSGVTTLALGQMHALAGTAVGRLYTWGTDEFGALGRGEASMKVDFNGCWI